MKHGTNFVGAGPRPRPRCDRRPLIRANRETCGQVVAGSGDPRRTPCSVRVPSVARKQADLPSGTVRVAVECEG